MSSINPLQREPMRHVDTAWLRMDTDDNLMVINGLLFFDEPMTQEEFRSLIEERWLVQHRRFHMVPVAQGNRYFWQEVAELDMDYHLQSLSLPATADEDAMDEERALREVVSGIVSQPLDKTKPLWCFHFLADYLGGSAVVVRLHHCYADGIALISVLDSIADKSVLQSSPAARFSVPQRKPKSSNLLHRAGYLFSSAGFYLGFSSAWLFEAMRVSLCRPDSKTAYKRPLSMEKRVGWAPSIPVRDVKEVGRALGCTMNDVILGCVAGSLRRYLARQDEPVDGVCVRATIPVNLRPLKRALELGNHFGVVYLELPVGEPTVRQRIKAVQSTMKKLKNGVQAVMSYNVLSILGFFPHWFERWALQFFSSKASAVMTNVPGPKEPVVLKGKKLSKPMFWVPQSGGIGLGVSILTYEDKVEFGFVADAALVPDPQAMIDDFVAEFRAIQAEVLGAPAVDGALSKA